MFFKYVRKFSRITFQKWGIKYVWELSTKTFKPIVFIFSYFQNLLSSSFNSILALAWPMQRIDFTEKHWQNFYLQDSDSVPAG